MKSRHLLLPVSLFILIFFNIMVYSTPAVAELRGHWKFDETTGTDAGDSSGYGNDGILVNGPVWTAGQVDGALRFDGQNDSVAVDPSPLSMNSWSEITVAAWVRNDVGNGAGTDDILSWWRWNGYPCSDCSFVLTHHGNNQYFFEIRGTAVSGGSVSTDWTHVAATYDGSTVSLYIDGSLVDSTPYAGAIPSSSSDLIIAGQGDSSNYFDGIIDDVQLFDHALSAQEIQDLFNGTPPDPDTTPPSVPENLAEVSADFTSIEIAWTESDDPESGIDHYNIYRDALKVGESSTASYLDSGLQPDQTYTYEVSAVNGQGLESLNSDQINVTTLADITPPALLSANATSETSVVVVFDEDLDSSSASTAGNYIIDNNITVSSASLGPDNRTVTLTTSNHTEGIQYELEVSGVQDLFGNVMPPTIENYTVVLTDPSLVANWELNDGSGGLAADSTGNGNNGTLFNGPQWTPGGHNGALILDGQNDHVVVNAAPLAMETWSEISVGAWVKSDIGAGAGTDDIISQWNYPSSRGWVLTHHNNNQYFWEIDGKGYLSGGSVSTDWTHVLGTYDGSAMRLYVNGVEVASVAGISGNLPNSTANIVIGGQADGSNFFAGIIDEVKIYGRSLSVEEIQEIVADFNPGQVNIPPTVSASASPQVGIVPLTVQFTSNAQDADGTIESYAWTFGDGGVSNLQNPEHTYATAGMYTTRVVVTDNQGATAEDSVAVDAVLGPQGPTLIDVWHSPDQKDVGYIGIPQNWFNILGNVSDPDGIASLSYTLNGGSQVDLSVGPDNRRLSMTGDFNIDIDWADLEPQHVQTTNTVEIKAIDQLGTQTTKTVELRYDDTNIWPLPYSVDWSAVSNIEDVVQVVDGRWSRTTGGLRVADMGYDRVFAIGDVFWTDYEVTAPITVHAYDTGPLPPYSGTYAGFGITLRWTGHTDSPVTCSQPKCGWLPSGAGAWYFIGSDGPLLLDGSTDPAMTIDVGETYIWKFRVETDAQAGPLYSLKVWHKDLTEPAGWNIQKQRTQADEPQGSLIFVLHHVDATIGNITVIPVGTSVPDTFPPTVDSVAAVSDSEVVVVFSEPVEQNSATDYQNNYSIDNGIIISGASLAADERTVTLTTLNAHQESVLYTILISGVTDKAPSPNMMVPDSLEYTFVPQQPKQPNLQYLFDDGSGPVASDTSGNGYDGTLVNNPTWFNDPQRGSVIDLDGVNDHVAVNALQLGMDSWDELTVAAWVKSDIGAGAGTDDILSWWRWTGYPCSDCSFVLTHHNNGQYFFQMGDTYLSGGAVSTNWSHVVATYDGSLIRLYVDGSEVASAPHSGGIPSASANLIVGGQGDGSNYFDGRIDKVEIFDVALTAQEVLSHYNQ